MIKNYLKTAWRTLKINKVFSFINVFGLSVGLACCMLISSYLYQELNYDTYPEKSGQIYRVGLHLTENGAITDFPFVDVAVGAGMKNAIPGITASVRLAGRGPVYIKYGSNQFKEQHIALADSNFLQMFSIPLLEGTYASALKEPHSIVITKAMEKKYFGSASAMGKMLNIPDNYPLKVTGIIEKVPDNSHFHYDGFISMASLTQSTQQTWSNVSYFTYLLLDKAADPKKIEARFPELVAKYVVPEVQHDMGVSLAQAKNSVNTFRFYLQPITAIHLHSSSKYEIEPNGDIKYVYILGALAIFILLLACINFTNLSTASSAKRAKEVGIRKVMGSLKGSLVTQFLVESVMLTAFAMLFAIGLVYLLLPYFNELCQRNIPMSFFFNYKILLTQALLILGVGVLAGIYPAFILSSFQTISVLKGSLSTQPLKRNFLRSGLVVFQFAVSTGLIIATFIVYQQLHFMQNKKLGYDTDQMMVINDAYALGENIMAFKNEMVQDNRVIKSTISGSVPGGSDLDGTQIYAKEHTGNADRNEIHSNIYHVDEDYITTLGIQLAKGRNFYAGLADTSSVIINEAAVRDLGWSGTDPIGKTIVRSGQRQFTVVGVIKDFHYTSAKQKIAPLMLLAGHSYGNFIVKVKTKDIKQLIGKLETQWNAYTSAAPFSYTFLDEQFASLYSAELRTGKIFTSFAVIALIIASLGLFGLAAYMMRLRVKEIGIRKVLGASSANITKMLSAEFIQLVLIAVLISVPVTWYAMDHWLQDFAYRIHIQWWVFVLAGALAMLIAIITVSFQSVRAALSNPVKSLRSE
ncbi:ABC transporter permease [Mucilaginibacter gynuensis]|uniref:ABC transporter permease n=1 Tax=Mucilaginibacter gynuensis TaxID=1302236 RepID=A0ABP8FUK0_9SPHI